jgi:hypothetical protein
MRPNLQDAAPEKKAFCARPWPRRPPFPMSRAWYDDMDDGMSRAYCSGFAYRGCLGCRRMGAPRAGDVREAARGAEGDASCHHSLCGCLGMLLLAWLIDVLPVGLARQMGHWFGSMLYSVFFRWMTGYRIPEHHHHHSG